MDSNTDPQSRESDVPDDAGIPQRRVADLSVLQYQVGALQTALDRGIGGIEKTMDKGFESIGVRLDRFEERLKTIEERQAFDAARLKALEQFREEQDRREDERRRVADADLKASVDNSQAWKTARWIGTAIVALFTIAGIIFAIAGNL